MKLRKHLYATWEYINGLPLRELQDSSVLRPRNPVEPGLHIVTSLQHPYDFRRLRSWWLPYAPNSQVTVSTLCRQHVGLLLAG